MNGSSLGLSADVLSGMAVGVYGQPVSVDIASPIDGSTTTMSVPAFGIALNALQSESSVNILSTPNILTMDNEEAKIVVGRNIPFPVSTGRDNNGQPIVSYQREDVAITLKVTPQINESNYVTLEVFQEVQEVEEDSQGLDASTAGFITSKRSAETTVVVRDNQTVVIGGLIGTTDTEVETKVPLLGDLPLIGTFFRGRRNASRKTNMLIFLTPHIIDAPEDLEEVYRVKWAQRQEYIRRFYGKSKDQSEKALSKLLQYSINQIDQPSPWRTKVVDPFEDDTFTTIGADGDDVQTPQVREIGGNDDFADPSAGEPEEVQ
jgi:general secretion pathway protein D